MPAPLSLIAWPYHAGLRDVGMGRGPTVLAEELEPELGPAAVVEPVDETLPEVARVFELDRRLARAVAGADGFPLVLAGNCVSCLGTTAGVGADAVVWFDAHADFDTPDDNLSGFTDVMGLAILTGSGWRALRETVPGFRAIAERNVVLAGVRDLEPHQRERLERSDVRVVPGAADRDGLDEAIDELARRAERVYLHFDLDAIDAGELRANDYAAAGGISLEAALGAIDVVFERLPVVAASLTAFDPAVDQRALPAAVEVARRIASRYRRAAI